MPNIVMISLDSQHDWTGKALVSQAHSGFEKEGRTTLRGDLGRTKGEKDACAQASPFPFPAATPEHSHRAALLYVSSSL